jgi:hypothetical protein
MTRAATTEEVEAIRLQWDQGTIKTREWADMLGCSIETIRRIGRRETYRGVQTGQHISGPAPKGGSPLVNEPSSADVAASLARMADLVAKQGPKRADGLVEKLVKGPEE